VLEPQELIRFALDGNREARIRFQDQFGEIIYNYPMRAFHLPKDRAADFYIYVFDDDKIFRRARGFEAQNNAQFTTYLQYYVLRDLFLEWQRGQKEPETISLTTVVSDHSGGSSGTIEDFLADPGANVEESLDRAGDARGLKNFIERLDAEKRLLLKLLHLAEFDLSPEEIRFLCKKSGRSYREVIFDLEQIRSSLRKKDEQFTAVQAQLESIHGWILLYQKELRTLSERLSSLAEGSPQFTESSRQKDELERKVEWRYRQRAQTLEKAGQFHITTPYKDIARLLNAPIGTVCSLVARTRTEFSTAFRGFDELEEAAAT
jgi:RNA polymerase sigma factor (sigma-70 family)